jgi:tetratricopeptide (TPR) repeat protein
LRHWPNKLGILAAAVVLVAAAAAQADRIRTAKGIGYDGEISGLAPDGLNIKLSSGAEKAVPLADISKVTADKYPDLGRAEDAYAEASAGKGKTFADAEKLYRGLLTPGAPQWLRVLVNSRMFKVYADSGRAPEALDAFLELVKSQPRIAAGLKLPAPAEDAHEANKAMMKKVDDALRIAGDKPHASELRNFKAALLLREGGKAEDVEKTLEILIASKDERVRHGAMLKYVEFLVGAGRLDDAEAKLTAAAPELGEAYGAETAFWRGRILKERGKNMEAALEFIRVAIVYPAKDKARTAEALWWAGQAMEAAKAPRDEILKVYDEAAAKYPGAPGADKSRREKIRLGGK